MVRNRSSARSVATRNISHKRAGRLFRLISLLGSKGNSRPNLLKRLNLDLRGFYRDLEKLRELGVEVAVQGHHYHLKGTFYDAIAALPFPNPMLSFREATMLAKGTTSAHRRLRLQIKQVTGKHVIR